MVVVVTLTFSVTVLAFESTNVTLQEPAFCGVTVKVVGSANGPEAGDKVATGLLPPQVLLWMLNVPE
jgi:hypothetical protein